MGLAERVDGGTLRPLGLRKWWCLVDTRSVVTVALALALASTLAACGSAPDANSGGDAHRHEAAVIPLEDWATGELNRDEGDTTDWKQVVLQEASKLKVELSAESKGAVVAVAVFDKYGAILVKEGQIKGGGEVLSLAVAAPAPGPLFVRVTQRGGGKTVYSVRAVIAEVGSGGGGGPDL